MPQIMLGTDIMPWEPDGWYCGIAARKWNANHTVDTMRLLDEGNDQEFISTMMEIIAEPSEQTKVITQLMLAGF